MIFLNSASSAAALVFYLPLCTHTDTEGKPREARVRNIFFGKTFWKKTQYLINTLYIFIFKNIKKIKKKLGGALFLPWKEMHMLSALIIFVYLCIYIRKDEVRCRMVDMTAG